MRLDVKMSTAIDLLRQRNFSYVMNVFLMVIVGILSVKVVTLQPIITLVPAMNEPQKHYKLDGKHMPDNYLTDWASGLLSNIFTVNPQTIDQKNRIFLEWAVSSSALEEDLKKTTQLIKKEKMSTAFFPETFFVDREMRRVHVSGRFLSYFGRSQRPVEVERTFVLGWEIFPNGLIAIKSLEEKEKEKEDEKS